MYMPVLKNRMIEMGVIKGLMNISLCDKVIPMIEIIQESIRSNSDKTFIDDLVEIYNNDLAESFCLVDILKANVPKSTTDNVREFLTKVNRIPGFALDLLLQLNKVRNAIPVVSYNPDNIELNGIVSDSETLRKYFDRLAFRIKSNSFNNVFNTIIPIVTEGDIVILDIDSASHTNPALKLMYREIKKNKSTKGFTSFIINSTKPTDVVNKRLEDRQPILEIDNSLLEVYPTGSYGFDGFGDYACITNTLPTTGGAISPAGIYYSKDNNFFVGFKGRKQELAEFSYIAQSIVNSEYWKEFNQEHHEKCPGCKSIYDISMGEENGKNQAKWKAITMYHYIYTIHESLK